LQGHLTFASTEVLLRDVMERLDELDCLVLDFKRVLSINESACRFLHRLLLKLSPRAKSLVVVHAQTIPLLRKYMKRKLDRDFDALYLSFEDIDRALEWCENRLITAFVPGWNADHAVGRGEYDLFKGLTADEVQVISACLERQSFSAGEAIIRTGDDASELYFLAKGTVSVLVPTEAVTSKRLATFSAGMAFGEMAVLDRAPRSAMIVADSEVVCDVLKLSDFEELSVSHPAIKIQLLKNLSLSLCYRLRKANRELSVLE
jgi:glutaminase